MHYAVVCTFVNDDGTTGTRELSRRSLRDDALYDMKGYQRAAAAGERFSIRPVWSDEEYRAGQRRGALVQCDWLRADDYYMPLPDDIRDMIPPGTYHYPAIYVEFSDVGAVYITSFPDDLALVTGRSSNERLGPLLVKYGNMQPHQVHARIQKLLADRIAADYTITNDQALIREAFIGQRLKSESSSHDSCMRHSFDVVPEYHPCNAYGGESDLHLAIMRRLHDGRIIGRAVVWAAQQRFVRTYGINEAARAGIALWLESQGYRRTAGFEDAKIVPIKHPRDENAVLVPYIDGTTRSCTLEGRLVRDHYDRSPGLIPVQNASCVYTRVVEQMVICAECDRQVPASSAQQYMRSAHGGTARLAMTCRQCAAHMSTCQYHNRLTTQRTELVVMARPTTTRMWSSSALSEHAFYCHITARWYRGGTFTRIRVRLPSGGWVFGCYEVLAVTPTDTMDAGERVFVPNMRSATMRRLMHENGWLATTTDVVAAPPAARARSTRELVEASSAAYDGAMTSVTVTNV